MRGHGRILVSGHNNHVKKTETAGDPVLGCLLADELGEEYFVIGTDFYRSECNLPQSYTGKRITYTFSSGNPLAKAAKECGFAMAYLEFSQIPQTSVLWGQVTEEIWMGALGEMYHPLYMNLLPRSYCVRRVPAEAYDAMILVTEAHPTVIRS